MQADYQALPQTRSLVDSRNQHTFYLLCKQVRRALAILFEQRNFLMVVD
jgi:hypothetical protein